MNVKVGKGSLLPPGNEMNTIFNDGIIHQTS